MVAATAAATVALRLTNVPAPATIAVIGGFAVAWPMLTFALGLHSVDGLRDWTGGVHQAPRLIVASLVVSWPLAGVLGGLGIDGAAALALAASGGAALGSIVLRALLRAVAHRAAPLRQRALIVGSGVVAAQVVSRLRNHEAIGVEAVGIADDDVADVGTLGVPTLGTIDELPELIQRESLDRVIISFTRARHDRFTSVLGVASASYTSTIATPWAAVPVPLPATCTV